MICVWQVFGGVQDFTSIAETFISALSEITTIFCSAPLNAEVWIKVCNVNSQEKDRGVYKVTI